MGNRRRIRSGLKPEKYWLENKIDGGENGDEEL